MDTSEIEKLDRNILKSIGLLKSNGSIHVTKGLEKIYGPPSNPFMLWTPRGTKYKVTQKALQFYFDKVDKNRQLAIEIFYETMDRVGSTEIVTALGGIAIPFDRVDDDFIKWVDHPDEFFTERMDWFLRRCIYSPIDMKHDLIDRGNRRLGSEITFNELIEKYEREDMPYLIHNMHLMKKYFDAKRMNRNNEEKKRIAEDE